MCFVRMAMVSLLDVTVTVRVSPSNAPVTAAVPVRGAPQAMPGYREAGTGAFATACTA
jgi:hypothetical protein